MTEAPPSYPSRWGLAAALAIVTPLGFLTKLYHGPGSSWVSSQLGGFFYVIFWVFLVLALAPRAAPGVVSAAVFAVTSALEFTQLWHPPVLTGIRATGLGHALIGSTFSWLDFPWYAAGCLGAWAGVRGLRGLHARRAGPDGGWRAPGVRRPG